MDAETLPVVKLKRPNQKNHQDAIKRESWFWGNLRLRTGLPVWKLDVYWSHSLLMNALIGWYPVALQIAMSALQVEKSLTFSQDIEFCCCLQSLNQNGCSCKSLSN